MTSSAPPMARRFGKRARNTIRAMLRRAGYDVVRADRAGQKLALLPLALGFAAGVSRQVSAVQVGANDGSDEFRDMVRALGARALLIEPNAGLVPQILHHYAGCESVEVETVAVDDRSGVRQLYIAGGETRAAYAALGLSATGVSSFHKAHVRRHLQEYFGAAESQQIDALEVPTAPLWKIAQDRGFFGADILQIDTEGHDLCVLRTAKLAAWKPAILVMEVAHLSDQDVGECRDLLRACGYRCYDEAPDLIALAHGGR